MTNLPQTEARLHEGIDAGLHRGAQVYVSRQGEPVAELAVGEAREGVAMTGDTILRWMSAGKPITAVAVAQCWERGELDFDEPVATYLPAFAQGGKERVTVRHLLTHTGGFRDARYDNVLDSWETIIARICETPLEPGWTLGETAGYHTLTSWYILGELVQRVSGEALPGYVRRHIFEPGGMMDSWLGMPAERHAAYGERIGVLYDTRGGEVRAGKWHTAEALGAVTPGGNACGPVRELGRFYEMLLAGGEGPGGRVIQQATVELLTHRHREDTHDLTFRQAMDWGMGFMVKSRADGPVPYDFGPGASEASFGHGGMQSSIAFADPEQGLVVAIVCNGLPGEPKHQRRMEAVLGAVYDDIR